MPIYEYMCKTCDKEFECLVLGSDKDITCPECKGENVQRLMSACRIKNGARAGAVSTGTSSCASCAGGSCSTCH